MSTPFDVTIQMSIGTVEALANSNFTLYGFKAVQSTLGGGAPLVWFESQTFSMVTNVSWVSQYQAYTSTQSMSGDVTISASFTTPIDLGQTLNITSSTGIGAVSSGGVPTAISISNTSGTPFTCGLSQSEGGSTPSPLCAFPLFGQGMDVIQPIEKVLLTFATQPLNTGTVIEQAFAPGYLIDMTGAPGNSRTVSFDINMGWSNGSAVWATQVPPNANLVPLLIDNSPSVVSKLRALAR